LRGSTNSSRFGNNGSRGRAPSSVASCPFAEMP
jgi:hypothetical protein